MANRHTQDQTDLLWRSGWEHNSAYPVHHVPDDPQPVVLALDPVDRLLLTQVMADVVEVAVEKNLPLPLSLYDHLPLLLFLGSHIVQLALLMNR